MFGFGSGAGRLLDYGGKYAVSKCLVVGAVLYVHIVGHRERVPRVSPWASSLTVWSISA